ncbi:hypothetical protein [Candidatus Tisiphia endosymbiont of Sialis lutaria]
MFFVYYTSLILISQQSHYRRFHSSIGYKKPMNVYLNSMQNYEQIAA